MGKKDENSKNEEIQNEEEKLKKEEKQKKEEEPKKDEKEKKTEVEKKKSSKGIIIAIVIVILLLIAVAIFICVKETNKMVEDTNTKVELSEVTVQADPETGEAVVERSISVIDMNNTENAKIENNVKTNISDALSKEKNIKGVELKNIKLYTDHDCSCFEAEVVNNSEKDIEEQSLEIIFVDKDGKKITTLNSYVGNIPKGQTGVINSSTTEDIVNAYDFNVEFK